MSLVRAIPAIRRRPCASVVCLSHRNAASASHSNEHHEHQEHDSTEYPKEDFRGSVWRKTVIFSLLAVGFYKFGPEPSDDVYLTRWMAMYATPRDRWLSLNVKHTAMQKDNSEQTILIADAKRPPVHRYRFPQILDQASPFLRPVGLEADVSGAVIKSDKDF